MSNVIDSVLFDRLYAMAFKAFRQKLGVVQCLSRFDLTDQMDKSYSKGNTLIIPLPALFTETDVVDVVPGPIPPTGTDIELRFATVTLDYYKKVNYHFTDQELVFLQDRTLSNQLMAAVDALATTITRTIWANHVLANNAIGQIGTPVLASDTAIIQQAHSILSANGVPNSDRHLLLDPFTYGNALGLPIFQQYLQYGSTEVFREAKIPRALGFDWHEDNSLPSFTGGTLDNGTGKLADLDANVTAASKTAVLSDTTLTGTLKVGDIFSVAGDPNQYVISQDATASGNEITINFTPASGQAWTAGSLVTFLEDYTISGVAMHRQALAFASRRTDNVFPGGSMLNNFFDPNSGLSLSMEITRQYKQTNVELSCLWGSTLVRPESLVKLIS